MEAAMHRRLRKVNDRLVYEKVSVSQTQLGFPYFSINFTGLALLPEIPEPFFLENKIYTK